MSRLLATLTISTVMVFCSNSSHAYVVICDIDVGGTALDSTSTGGDSYDDEATGSLDALLGGEISGDLSFDTPSRRGEGRRGGSSGRNDRGSRFPRSGISRNGGGGAGGGGAGGGRRRGRAGRRGDRPVEQPIVEVNRPEPPSSGSSDDGGELTIYGESSSYGSSGSAGGGAGNGGGASAADEDGPGTGDGGAPCISGTPEPSTAIVWALAACCGYGAFRRSGSRRDS